jgi:hypothetical protein
VRVGKAVTASYVNPDVGVDVGMAKDGSYVGSEVGETVGVAVGLDVDEAVGFMDVVLSVGLEVGGFMAVGLLLGFDATATGLFVGGLETLVCVWGDCSRRQARDH